MEICGAQNVHAVSAESQIETSLELSEDKRSRHQDGFTSLGYDLIRRIMQRPELHLRDRVRFASVNATMHDAIVADEDHRRSLRLPRALHAFYTAFGSKSALTNDIGLLQHAMLASRQHLPDLIQAGFTRMLIVHVATYRKSPSLLRALMQHPDIQTWQKLEESYASHRPSNMPPLDGMRRQQTYYDEVRKNIPLLAAHEQQRCVEALLAHAQTPSELQSCVEHLSGAYARMAPCAQTRLREAMCRLTHADEQLRVFTQMARELPRLTAVDRADIFKALQACTPPSEQAPLLRQIAEHYACLDDAEREAAFKALHAISLQGDDASTSCALSGFARAGAALTPPQRTQILDTAWGFESRRHTLTAITPFLGRLSLFHGRERERILAFLLDERAYRRRELHPCAELLQSAADLSPQTRASFVTLLEDELYLPAQLFLGEQMARTLPCYDGALQSRIAQVIILRAARYPDEAAGDSALYELYRRYPELAPETRQILDDARMNVPKGRIKAVIAGRAASVSSVEDAALGETLSYLRETKTSIAASTVLASLLPRLALLERDVPIAFAAP